MPDDERATKDADDIRRHIEWSDADYARLSARWEAAQRKFAEKWLTMIIETRLEAEARAKSKK
jgi:hypothetical protein